jgi:hypothetical protein
MLCHTIALHTREVRELANVSQYIDYQLNMLLAGLMAHRVAQKKRAVRRGANSR